MSEKNTIIFGIRAVIEAIRAGKEIDRVFLKKGSNGELFNELLAILKQDNVPFLFVPIEKINRITTKNHQGVVAYLSEVSFHKIENLLPGIFETGKIPFILILDQITDVRNFGAICRTAECAGVDAIIIPEKGAAQINADAMKTSAGALNILPICRSSNLKNTVKFLQECGLKIFAATEKAHTIYVDESYNIPLGIVMGAEDTGVSTELIRIADSMIKIPVSGKIESLNVSVAAGIILYEVVSQRRVEK
ncbi:MAG: 23S rRNA (guanosine(2251)-2'-O)-methyltransferase RlmB [Bacteroidetes bacterium RIFOXYA12_FULL_35_11]|nr:MAG: 23S rRNA (guanosine(2251)-2'-O)-methyltransferase RlmB [Bacteroidetes bacterium GWF2_35_48]OFY80273.1 MAG: 23S rRNA (guanosine(2251)-2'-O)-methyltransferase RlmB [Bacteroidetes bacterium RIFOXYA12_FULL_35_11]OFY96268.1 MAG: 23S rRNA (guanosine(2251)-2'-O)-methyltransferase RlmB [Bacteroidetes bacterium RIFOXYB2_FULL_35_7]OFZ01584.1 MAG: 23S rRNA (guanosine(2251)-2'-O)-methyltransferase RlmB [Bacteroidetes bacterium RIFOXYC12_FULL_35_7]HBX50452.1 23S rRNA (guanosine(2251)-2'-O)-methyltra